MSLIDTLKEAPGLKPKSRVAVILLELPDAERAAVETALRDPEWPHEGLARVLTAQGYPVTEASIRRYRRGIV